MANTLNYFSDVGKHVLAAKDNLTFLTSFLDSKSTKTQNAIKTWTKALSGNRRSGLQSAERDRVLFYWESANSTHLAATRLREFFPQHKNSDTSSKYFTIYYVLVCIPLIGCTERSTNSVYTHDTLTG